MGVRRVAAVVSVVLALPACTSSEAETDVVPTYRPEFAESTCPPELTAGVLLEMSCGFLTVPQDRNDPRGRAIKVFVARINHRAAIRRPIRCSISEGTSGSAPTSAATPRWRTVSDAR